MNSENFKSIEEPKSKTNNQVLQDAEKALNFKKIPNISELKTDVQKRKKTADEFSSKKKELKLLTKNSKNMDVSHKMVDGFSESLLDSKLNREIGNLCLEKFF